MNTVEQWSVLLAQEIAPDEIDLAPDIVNAYIAGGKERQNLFAGAQESAVGSFGAVDVVLLLPAALNIITLVWAQVQPILSNVGWVKDCVSVAKEMLEIRDLATKHKKVEQLPAVQPYASMKVLISQIESQLQALPINKDQRDLLTFRLLKVILENPSGTEAFVTRIKKG